jgi:hypothetical protein
MSADDGVGYQRRLKIDFDGNLRLSSQEDGRDTWVVSWQALSRPCRIQGTCRHMFLIWVENVLAFQDSRSRIIQTGLWVVNQISIFIVVKMRLASFN